MTTTILQLSEILQRLLIEDANHIGRKSGFIQRERKFNGSSFVRSLVFGWQGNPRASLEELCQSAGVSGIEISPQGLQERINSPQACAFLRQLLLKSLEYVVSSNGCEAQLLQQFNGVYLQDSTSISLPAALVSVWQGCASHHSTKSILKVQTVLNYQHGQLDLTLAHGRQHDSPLQTTHLPSGSLRLADVGYFNVRILHHLTQSGVFWVSRLPARVGIWQTDKVVHLATYLANRTEHVLDVSLEITAQRLPCRLIAVRVPDEVTRQRQMRVTKDARKRAHRLKSQTLALCEWTLIVTNMTLEQLSLVDALSLLRLRWQIELIFKLWKQVLSMDDWRSHHPWQILCEIYAKLLLVVIQNWLMIVGCWHRLERSCDKAAQVLRKHAFHLASVLTNLPYLITTLTQITASLSRCLVHKRKTRPATFQLLSRAFP